VSIAKLGSRGLPWLLAVAFLIASCGSGKPATPGLFDLTDAKPVVSITFPPGDVEPGAPASVAYGDFNGDGKMDLLVGAPYAAGPNGTRPDAGEAYVIYGPLSGHIDLSNRQPDVRILGAVSGDNLGGGVAAGDLNGDGVDDIIVGAPLSNGLKDVRTDSGEAYVVFGGLHIASTIDTASVQQDFALLPAEGFSHLGGTFAVGDVNGDGIDDIIVGASGYDGPARDRTDAGGTFVFYGSKTLPKHETLKDADVTITGADADDSFGTLVAAADVNGDGKKKVIASAPAAAGPDNKRNAAGEVSIVDVAHAPAPATVIDLAKAGSAHRIFGPSPVEFAPSSMAVSVAGGTARIAFWRQSPRLRRPR
jgi:FG-GAP repeat